MARTQDPERLGLSIHHRRRHFRRFDTHLRSQDVRYWVSNVQSTTQSLLSSQNEDNEDYDEIFNEMDRTGQVNVDFLEYVAAVNEGIADRAIDSPESPSAYRPCDANVVIQQPVATNECDDEHCIDIDRGESRRVRRERQEFTEALELIERSPAPDLFMDMEEMEGDNFSIMRSLIAEEMKEFGEKRRAEQETWANFDNSRANDGRVDAEPRSKRYKQKKGDDADGKKDANDKRGANDKKGANKKGTKLQINNVELGEFNPSRIQQPRGMNTGPEVDIKNLCIVDELQLAKKKKKTKKTKTRTRRVVRTNEDVIYNLSVDVVDVRSGKVHTLRSNVRRSAILNAMRRLNGVTVPTEARNERSIEEENIQRVRQLAQQIRFNPESTKKTGQTVTFNRTMCRPLEEQALDQNTLDAIKEKINRYKRIGRQIDQRERELNTSQQVEEAIHSKITDYVNRKRAQMENRVVCRGLDSSVVADLARRANLVQNYRRLIRILRSARDTHGIQTRILREDDVSSHVNLIRFTFPPPTDTDTVNQMVITVDLNNFQCRCKYFDIEKQHTHTQFFGEFSIFIKYNLLDNL